MIAVRNRWVRLYQCLLRELTSPSRHLHIPALSRTRLTKQQMDDSDASFQLHSSPPHPDANILILASRSNLSVILDTVLF